MIRVRKTPVPRAYLPRPTTDTAITRVPEDPNEYEQLVEIEKAIHRRRVDNRTE